MMKRKLALRKIGLVRQLCNMGLRFLIVWMEIVEQKNGDKNQFIAILYGLNLYF